MKIIFTLSGLIFDCPTRETIHIGNNKHIYDKYGIYINYSDSHNIYKDGYNVIALRDIKINEELCFNYDEKS